MSTKPQPFSRPEKDRPPKRNGSQNEALGLTGSRGAAQSVQSAIKGERAEVRDVTEAPGLLSPPETRWAQGPGLCRNTGRDDGGPVTPARTLAKATDAEHDFMGYTVIWGLSSAMQNSSLHDGIHPAPEVEITNPSKRTACGGPCDEVMIINSRKRTRTRTHTHGHTGN